MWVKKPSLESEVVELNGVNAALSRLDERRMEGRQKAVGGGEEEVEGVRQTAFASDEDKQRVGQRGFERLARQIHVRGVGREHVYSGEDCERQP